MNAAASYSPAGVYARQQMDIFAPLRPMDLDATAKHCAAQLVAEFDLSAREAIGVARRELGEICAPFANGGYIEYDLSNSHMLVINDTERGTQHLLCADELIAFARQRASELRRVYGDQALRAEMRLRCKPPLEPSG